MQNLNTFRKNRVRITLFVLSISAKEKVFGLAQALLNLNRLASLTEIPQDLAAVWLGPKLNPGILESRMTWVTDSRVTSAPNPQARRLK